MRTWVRRGGVSGFRFDLATILARRPDGFDPAAPLLAAIDQDPELRGLKLIAEPWDCGLGGYQLGRFPGAWGEWNDQFRDGARGFWRGDAMPLGRLADIWSGSRWTMARHGRPSRSVNFVTAHDGFTLADLVSYETNNASWNCGAEGPVADGAIRARRARDQRALLATLLLARGTPMLSMGAEMGQSQGGNNNAYCQDGPITWLDWAGADKALLAFARKLIAARREHVALRADRFLTGVADDGPYPDVEWRRPDGAPMNGEDWEDPHGRCLVMVLAAQEGGTLDRAMIVAHRGDVVLPVHLPEPRGGRVWKLLIDSADDQRTGALNEDWIEVAARSVALLVEAPARRAPKDVSDEVLAEVAQAAGIASDWWSLDGERHIVSADTQRSLLDAMGYCARTSDQAREALWRLAAAERRALPFVQVARQGEPLTVPVRDGSSWLETAAEDAAVISARVSDGQAQLPDLPPGRYALQAGAAQGRLIVAPARAHEPALAREGLLGLSVQLYSLRTREGARGMGDFGALAQLGQEAASQGLGLIGANPFHALFPQDRSRASPYYPSDRRFLDPIYIDVTGLDGASPVGRDDGALVDYPRVWAHKIERLEGAFEAFERRGDKLDSFEAFLAQGGAALERFAAFQAIGETHPSPWRNWPGGLAQAHSRAVTTFIRQNRRRVRFHQYLQWLADSQLAQAAAQAPGLGLYRDLAVGAAPDGAEVWADAEQFAPGASIGAPPDPLGPQGQVWGMPPPNPHLWAQSAYDSFAALLRSNMRHAGALRIDHVLGLARLFWVPQGASAAEGAYVRYPLEDLLGVLALESARGRCLVVGEDLGTASDGLRPALERTGVYSYRVLPFEREGAAFKAPDRYPVQALACVCTHDLPPLEGWWSGVDLDEREALGHLTPDDMAAAMEARESDKGALLQALLEAGLGEWSAQAPMSDALAGALHAYVASSPSRLVLAQIEDLAGERAGVNLPGTDRERPNWRRRLSMPLPDLWSSPRCRAILAAMREARAAQH
jgi:glycogen operon protein